MQNNIRITAVIPTCNRKASLLRLLTSLNRSQYPLETVIIVDSGGERLDKDTYQNFTNLTIHYTVTTDRSVCIQRNIGIHKANSSWIFLCDDDLEVPADYLDKLVKHAELHHEAGAISGFFLQRREGQWKERFPLTSTVELLWRFVFKLTIWGEINCRDTIFTRPLKKYYNRRGNHISKSGWPVITDFSEPYFRTPVYTLGAALVKREWLLNSQYDDILDPHGIGDNYGVAIGFPVEGIHLLNSAFVYHLEEQANRIERPEQFFRRAMAIDYFMKTRKELKGSKSMWFLWSLIGSMFGFIFSKRIKMAKVTIKLFFKIVSGNNPYLLGKRSGARIVVPQL